MPFSKMLVSSAHNGTFYFGYKDHIKADEKTLLITDYKVTAANVHDSVVMGYLVSKKDDVGQPLHADSACRSEDIEAMLLKKKIVSQIHEKGYRNHPLTQGQKQSNTKKSKIRTRIEHVFAFMTNSMNDIYLQYRSLKRITEAIGLINLTYNLCRLVQLNIVLSK